MKFQKRFLTIILIFFIISSAINVSATENEYIISMPNATTRSHDSSFELDFNISQAWILDFDNNAFAMLNHRYVTIDYESCLPSNTLGTVKLELYIANEDGEYEVYDPNGGYTYELNVGSYIKIKLPNGNTVEDYRLLFVNKTSSVTSGNFSVTTSRS